MAITIQAAFNDSAVTDDEVVSDALEAKTRAEAAEAEAGSPHRWRMADAYARLTERGWTQTEIAGRCKVTQGTVSKYIACARRYSHENTRPRFTDAFEEVSGRSAHIAHDLVASNENEWYTPARYIEAARVVLEGIDLDPASSPAANETVGATRFLTAEDAPFTQTWRGRVWLNPPYGGLAGSFVNRLVDEYHEGNVTAAIALVNAHCTDTAWFQPLWNQLLCFTDHRIDFDSAGREKTTSSTHGSVFAYFGTSHEAFIREFGRFGPIVTRV